MKWDAVGSILKQTNRKHQLTIKTCIKYVDKNSPAKHLQISSCSIATLSHVCNYKVQFFALKGDAQNLPLRRVGRGRSPPSSSQRLTGMGYSSKELKCVILESWSDGVKYYKKIFELQIKDKFIHNHLDYTGRHI